MKTVVQPFIYNADAFNQENLYGYINPPGVEMELVGIEKKELERLRELEAQVLSQARTCRRNPVSDCCTLAQKLLQVKPELKGWLEKHYGEYL